MHCVQLVMHLLYTNMLNYSNTAGSKACQAFSNTAMEDVPFQKDDPDMSQKKTDILPKGCINLDGDTMQLTTPPAKSINISGIDIYQECIDGLFPCTMVNDNIVSYLLV